MASALGRDNRDKRVYCFALHLEGLAVVAFLFGNGWPPAFDRGP